MLDTLEGFALLSMGKEPQFHVKSRASTVMDGMVAATRQVITAKPKLAELKITFNLGHPCQPIPYALFNLLDTPTIPILHCPLRGPHWQFTVLFMAFPSHPLWGTLSVFATIKLARTGITCWWTDIQCIRIQE
ncbi:hypothetical protein ABBQ32_000993 [Trebouxia sp. C0010 RCD-2024]